MYKNLNHVIIIHNIFINSTLKQEKNKNYKRNKKEEDFACELL